MTMDKDDIPLAERAVNLRLLKIRARVVSTDRNPFSSKLRRVRGLNHCSQKALITDLVSDLNDHLHQLQGRLFWAPKLRELLKGTESTAKVESSCLLVSPIRVGGTERFHLEELDTGTSEGVLGVLDHFATDPPAVMLRHNGHDVNLGRVRVVS